MIFTFKINTTTTENLNKIIIKFSKIKEREAKW